MKKENKFFREQHRFFGDLLDEWMTHAEARKRVFGITRSAYGALAPADKDAARRDAKRQMQDRYGEIFQPRHDCIYNCDRPKVSPQALALGGTVLNVMQDVEFLGAKRARSSF
jgi:hypothetical protein